MTNLYNEKFIAIAKKTLKNVDFDTMVGIGLSGVLTVAKLSEPLKKYALYLRKDANSTHSLSYEEGSIGNKWILIDDLIASGETLKVVCERVKNILAEHKHESKFVGAYIYQGSIANPRKGFFSTDDEFLKNIIKTKGIEI